MIDYPFIIQAYFVLHLVWEEFYQCGDKRFENPVLASENQKEIIGWLVSWKINTVSSKPWNN